MGKLIECSGKVASRPYFFRLTETNVYTIEEVCYYIRNNIYTMQEEVFDRSFANWLREGLDMDETASKLESMIDDHSNLKDIVVTLCCSCDYYDEQQINELISIMDATENLPVRGRRKIKADNYLRCGALQKAYDEYERILSSNDMLNADISEYGAIYHNMGVALAGLGSFEKASVAFRNACEKEGGDDSLGCYVYALRLVGDMEAYKKGCLEMNISEEKLKVFEKKYVECDRKSGLSTDVKKIEKLDEIRSSGKLEEYYDKVEKYIHQWKEEYRRAICV